jgi:hypothetical protein
MNAYQATLCLLFNEREQWSCNELATHTKLSVEETRRCITGLVLGKYKILKIATATSANTTSPEEEDTTTTTSTNTSTTVVKKINMEDRLEFNTQFTNKGIKMKIPVPKINVKRTSAGLTEDAEMHRRLVIDAAIVRIMKARRNMNHQQLIAEVIEQLRLFKPMPKDIKQRIEDLINREFLMRHATDASMYSLSFSFHPLVISNPKYLISCNIVFLGNNLLDMWLRIFFVLINDRKPSPFKKKDFLFFDRMMGGASCGDAGAILCHDIIHFFF